jgi:ABC-type lipopolysaccharide export system ATPase subunit
MKVADLERGTLLTAAGDNECFSICGIDEKWLSVIQKPRINRRNISYPIPSISKSKIAVYLGTKKDISVDMKWTDKFVLIDNEIVGVDPAAWRRIKKI